MFAKTLMHGCVMFAFTCQGEITHCNGMSAMFATLTSRVAASFSPPLAELTSQGPPSRVNPTSLQLALIGSGTLALYTLAKRLRESRRQQRAIQTQLNFLPVAPAPVAAPHYAQPTQPPVSAPAEHAA